MPQGSGRPVERGVSRPGLCHRRDAVRIIYPLALHCLHACDAPSSPRQLAQGADSRPRRLTSPAVGGGAHRTASYSEPKKGSCPRWEHEPFLRFPASCRRRSADCRKEYSHFISMRSSYCGVATRPDESCAARVSIEYPCDAAAEL